VTTAVLFAGALFFLPLIQPLQHLTYAYAPALIVVGLLMISSIKRIDFEDMSELVPAFATVAMMVFTYNIGNGLTAGCAVPHHEDRHGARERAETGWDTFGSSVRGLFRFRPASLTLS